MAQRPDIVEKKRVLIDGNELNGLVSCSPITFEEGVVDIPEPSRIRHARNGVDVVPRFTLVYKVQRDAASLTLFRNWKVNKETHDVTIIRTDATGVEFARDMCQLCDCVKLEEPEFDAANPTYAKITADIIPYEVVPMAAQ